MKFGEEKALKNRENEEEKNNNEMENEINLIWSDLVLCWLFSNWSERMNGCGGGSDRQSFGLKFAGLKK